MSLDRRLTDHLRARADAIEATGRGVDMTMRKGRALMIRRRLFITVGAAAAVVAGIVGVLSLGSIFDDDVAPPAAADAVDTTLPGTVTAADFDWYSVPGTLAWAQSIVFGDDGIAYALSTAPGQRGGAVDRTPALYSSDDGETWAFSVLSADLPSQAIAQRDGTLYLVGTAPGRADIEPAVQFATSTDAGGSWQTTSLPVSLASPNLPVFGSPYSQSWIASGEQGVLVATQLTYGVDWSSLIPPDLAGPDMGAGPAEDGIVVWDYTQIDDSGNAGVARTLTWDELGIEDPGDTTVVEMFMIEGDAATKVTSPTTGRQGVAGLYSTSGGYLLVENAAPADIDLAREEQAPSVSNVRIWLTDDGRTWELQEGLPAMDWVMTAGSTGGDVVVVGSAAGRPVVVRSTGAGWITTDLIDALGLQANGETWVEGGGIGPLGIVVGIGGSNNFSDHMSLAYSGDGGSWTLAPDVVARGEGYLNNVVVGEDMILGIVTQFTPNQPVATPVQIVATPFS